MPGKPPSLIVALCLLAAGFSPSPGTAQTTNEYQNGVGGYAGETDATISTEDTDYTGGNGYTTTDSELAAWRLTDYETRALIRFQQLNLPVGSEVQSATLQLTFDNYDSGFTLVGSYLQVAWNPLATGDQGLGWLYRDNGVNWNTPGAYGIGTDVFAATTFTFSGFQGTGHEQLSVALDPTIVQLWVNADSASQGFILDNTVSNISPRIYWAGAPATNDRPKLFIVYQPGVPPTIAQAANAFPNPVTGLTNGVTVLGADPHGEPTLAYLWSAAATPAGAPSPNFSPNGVNAAKTSTVTYGKAGPYALQAVVRDQEGLTATSTVQVVVAPTSSSIVVSPARATVLTNGTQQFSAVLVDQFGDPVASQPASFAWSVAGGGMINSTGQFTAGSVAGGPYQIAAQSAGLTGRGAVQVVFPNQLPQVSITSPADGAAFVQSNNIAIIAAATDPDGTVTNVEFFADGGLLGAMASPPYSLVWTNPPVGAHTLFATAFDNDGASSNSAPVNLTVISPPPPTQYTIGLTESGAATPVDYLVPVISDAQPSPDSLTPPFSVTVPNTQAPRLLNVVSPAIAIPFNSTIREIEAYWNGTPLPVIDPSGTEITETPHSYGSEIPFFKSLFSLAAIPAGGGTLEIRAFDSNHSQLTSVWISNLTVAVPPTPISTAALGATPHPRIYLTPTRLAAMQARPPTESARQRYEAALDFFTNAMASIPDVNSPAFEDLVYSHEDYIPVLALTYQLQKNNNPALAALAAGAAHDLTTNIASGYATGQRSFARDTGYDIRFVLRNLMLAYDWMHDQFSADERATLVEVATNWVNWYHQTGYPDSTPGGGAGPGYAESKPYENYYAGDLQGIALTAIATAGDNPDDEAVFNLLRSKLANQLPVINQRAAGGDWPEGWNYGPYTVLEFPLVNTLLRDIGEDWSADFDWLQPLPVSLLYMTAPDFSQVRSYGGYSGDYPARTSPAMLAVLSATTGSGTYASLLYSNVTANPNSNFADEQSPSSESFYEMIFATNRPATDLSTLPLSYFNAGTGRFFSRSSLTNVDAYFVSTENTSYIGDHYGYANGDVRLYQGTNCLVCPSAYQGPEFAGEGTTPYFSTYLVNGNPQEASYNNRNNQTTVLADTGTYSAVVLRLESSYASGRYDENVFDPANPLDYLIREVVHLRPGTLIVRDLHRRRHSTDLLAAQFHLGLTNQVQPSSGHFQIGSLGISTLYPPGVTVAFGADTDGGGNLIGKLMQLNFSSSTTPMELITVFSQTLTATGYTNHVLTLNNGTSITFAANGALTVSTTPKLTARRAANSVIVSWPSSATNFVLQQCSDLATGNWTISDSTISDDGTNQNFSVTPPKGNLFFRLSQP